MNKKIKVLVIPSDKTGVGNFVQLTRMYTLQNIIVMNLTLTLCIICQMET